MLVWDDPNFCETCVPLLLRAYAIAMRAAGYVGRVGGLAVTLGVGAALVTGTGVAWADTPSPSGSSSDTSSAQSADKPETEKPATAKPETAKPTTPDTTDSESAEDTADVEPTPTADADPAGTSERAQPWTESEPSSASKKSAVSKPQPKSAQAPARTVAANEVKVEAPTARVALTFPPETRPTEQSDFTAAPRVIAAQLEAHPTATPVSVPSLRPYPTAVDPLSAVSDVGNLVTSLVSAVLNPFAAGLPARPAEPPTAWTLLAWVRRELFNESPTIAYDATDNEQTLNADGDVVVKGSIGADDGDGDTKTYTVVGRPLNGGTVDIDEDGNFTYRPMNAMAAVGGTDQFTVVVTDEAAGLHVHGPLGLLQFVPIVGSLLYPSAGHRVAQTIVVTIDPVAGVDLSFPAGFHWGVAHAGFQAEGGPGSPVDPNSDWYTWVHDPINQLLGLTHGVPENGPGTYVNYDTDAELAREELGMNTFRMGIEWSRIFPESTAAVDISDEYGVVSMADLEALDTLADKDEVAHYRAVLTSLRAHGLEPMVTANHFTLPTWVHDPTVARPLIQLGLPAAQAGWLSPSTAVEFEKYAAYIAWKYGDQVDDWATINEPFSPILTEFFAIPGLVPAWPPGLVRPDLASTFLVNEARGHVAAYDAIHLWDTKVATAGQAPAFVGFTNNMIPARPADPVNPLDVQAADAWNTFYNRWFPNAVIDGWVDANFDGVKTADEVHDEFKNKVDFMGVQYYGSQPMQGFGVAPIPGFPFLRGLPIRCAAESPTCSDFNQPTDPGGFREVLEVAASYGKPLWVTENGIADAGDSKRPPYLVNHVAVVQDMVRHHVDIRGYTYWSFVDNLEWAEGYDLQFGLYGSDPTTPERERTPKPASISAISQITKGNALPVGLLGTYVPNL
jgi:beta-galactosidase